MHAYWNVQLSRRVSLSLDLDLNYQTFWLGMDVQQVEERHFLTVAQNMYMPNDLQVHDKVL